jgi:predicted nuclease with TOPRIM domain
MAKEKKLSSMDKVSGEEWYAALTNARKHSQKLREQIVEQEAIYAKVAEERDKYQEELNKLKQRFPDWKYEETLEFTEIAYGHIVKHAYSVKFDNIAIKELCKCPTSDVTSILYILYATRMCEFTRTQYKCEPISDE